MYKKSTAGGNFFKHIHLQTIETAIYLVNLPFLPPTSYHHENLHCFRLLRAGHEPAPRRLCHDNEVQRNRKGSLILVFYASNTKYPQFDTLPAIPEEGRLSPVGIYLNISYMSFDVSQPAVAAAGLIPQSKPNYIFGVGTATSPSAMTISYPGSKVKSFALSSLYYGCQTDLAQAAASVPVACNITATGFKAGSSKPVAVQVFAFSPSPGLTAPLAFGTFEAAFQGLENVTYAQSPTTLTEFLLDNVMGSFMT